MSRRLRRNHSLAFKVNYKALTEEKFKWPKKGDALITLNGEQINWLLDGYNIVLMKPYKTLHYEHV